MAKESARLVFRGDHFLWMIVIFLDICATAIGSGLRDIGEYIYGSLIIYWVFLGFYGLVGIIYTIAYIIYLIYLIAEDKLNPSEAISETIQVALTYIAGTWLGTICRL